jgi:hypothetical protein
MTFSTPLDVVPNPGTESGLLPLPEGDRVGVRGFGHLDRLVTPSPDRLRRSTSPLRGEVKPRHGRRLNRQVLIRVKVR